MKYVIITIVLVIILILGYVFKNNLNLNAEDEDEDEENIEAETAKIALKVLKMSTHSITECQAIDYAIDCINIRVRLEQFIKEKEL